MKPEFDVVILACPPADQAEQIKVGIIGFEAGPGSEFTPCEKCGMSVVIGRKQREFRRANEHALVLCLSCMLLNFNPGDEIGLGNLGGEGGKYLLQDHPKP
jgi:hypothetical protein